MIRQISTHKNITDYEEIARNINDDTESVM